MAIVTPMTQAEKAQQDKGMPSLVRTGKVPKRLLRKATGCDPMCEECDECRVRLEAWLWPQIDEAVMKAIWGVIERLEIEVPKTLPSYVQTFYEGCIPEAVNIANDYIMTLRDGELEAKGFACQHVRKDY